MDEYKEVEIIENTAEARQNSPAGGHGHSEVKITKEHIEALLAGKVLMHDINYEYSTAFTLEGVEIPEEYEDY